MRAEIERLKTMKSIDQAIIQSQVTELTLARAEALQLRQEIQLQSDCMKEGKKIQYEGSVAVVVVFSLLRLILVLKTYTALAVVFFVCFKINSSAKN